jgi:hypothetical protein
MLAETEYAHASLHSLTRAPFHAQRAARAHRPARALAPRLRSNFARRSPFRAAIQQPVLVLLFARTCILSFALPLFFAGSFSP